MSVKEFMELKTFLGHQDCVRVPEKIYHYAKAQHSFFNIVCDVFNYGYIMGQRAERARKKHKLSNEYTGGLK